MAGFVARTSGLLLIAAPVVAGILIPSPPLQTHRPALIAAIRLPFTSSSSPAIGDVNGDGRPDIAVTSDNIGDVTRDRTDPLNVNAVGVFSWLGGRLRVVPGWPRKTRDATLALSMADLDGDGRDEVLAACGQDWAPPPMQQAGMPIVSRLYVFHGDGSYVAPWFPSDEESLIGLDFGHAYAAPTVADIDGNGRLAIFQASQGAWENGAFRHGSLRLWNVDGTLRAISQGDDPKLPWYTLDGFAMDNPPVIADLKGDGRKEVVAASFDGRLYAWDRDGKPVPGWFPSANAATRTPTGKPVRGAMTAADLFGDGRDEIVAGGYDGTLYCWDGAGRVRWTSAAGSGPMTPLTSGIAVGRLRRTGQERDIVQGDASGRVTVWSPNGKVRWSNVTTPGMPIEAEPSIGDVNGDGTQDVVAAGTDGYVYAWDGETGRLLWQMPTWWAPTPDGMRLESVFGTPSLCDLKGNGHLCVVVATAQRYIADVATHKWQGFGHLLVYDCGPGTCHADRLDWPQYRGNKERTGRWGKAKSAE